MSAADTEVLRGRTVLVTGATSGIGRACAEGFAARGARLVLAARRRERLDELAGGLRDGGTDCHAAPLDVRDRAAVDAFVAALPEEFRAVDVLVNNAGLAAGLDPLPGGSADDWEQMLDTNVKGLLWVTRAVVPGMIERDRGHVINIGSIAGRETYPRGAVYCASKAAVDRITRGLRLDLADTSIRVSTLDPGLVETEFSVVRFHGDADRARSVYRGMTPLTARDVADAAVWIATRPPHVQVAELVLFPTDQASSTVVRRRDTP